MNEVQLNISRSQSSALAVNKVIRNTYMLLSMTLFVSALCAVASMVMQVGQGTGFMLFIGGFIMTFVVRKNANSSMGLLAVFVFAALMGAALGPIISVYMLAYTNGSAIVAQALGGTAIIFLSLSGYALTSGKNFNFLGGFIFTGLMVAVVAMIANIFLQIPALSLAISSAVILIMSGFILFDTSRIMNGGERNYIMATVSLYLSIFNIFIHLLSLLGALTGRN
ncbi:MAG TPA: Bax inhibitor-1/YccA family protein [Gammaproteobacteria bacterium]|jgi:modulator of FtsH protease|nr:BAX inhibitor protein [Gammaproteobacteria bacterium]HIA59998.1 Bax inhibitor-1/YccA family protein [Gammaproteobacteria bacterium]HIF87900.1 Bax inhibitor-1/YccA family protein [Gammaproteobacteria bacterium]HIL63755.1 Bax inhibitor-1/YccA family protein [Porticoccaceae bacterium]HIN89029.1 Bax inhibitor-1/YccA family protein [Porticoccaceae bacterium]|tara:strand:- start:13541 stop:14212 length:672 start_codon:yes stop_codon:yes gene_type:complete